MGLITQQGGLRARVARLERKQMATQAEVDELTKKLQEAEQAILTEVAKLEKEVEAGKGNELNLEPLKAEVAKIGAIPTPVAAPATPPGAPAGASEQAPTKEDGTAVADTSQVQETEPHGTI